MGRTRVLTVFAGSISAGEFEVYSWGPFRGSIRILRFALRNGATAATSTSMGLFVASTPDRPSGVTPAVVTAFPGWTALHDPSEVNTPNNADLTARFLPYQQGVAGVPVVMEGARIDIRGDLFWLKLYSMNSTAGGLAQHHQIWIEENPADLSDSAIVVRPQPGDGPTPPPPEAPSPQAPATPTTPAPPPSGQLPPNLPPPLPGAFPRITIDPHDPLTSALEPV